MDKGMILLKIQQIQEHLKDLKNEIMGPKTVIDPLLKPESVTQPQPSNNGTTKSNLSTSDPSYGTILKKSALLQQHLNKQWPMMLWQDVCNYCKLNMGYRYWMKLDNEWRQVKIRAFLEKRLDDGDIGMGDLDNLLAMLDRGLNDAQ
jgi:hypothetical protein